MCSRTSEQYTAKLLFLRASTIDHLPLFRRNIDQNMYSPYHEIVRKKRAIF